MEMRRTRIASLIGLLLLSASCWCADFSREWNACVSTIRQQYYAAETKRPQLDGLFREYGEAATDASSRPEFVRIVNEMIQKIGDSHFELHANYQQSYFIMESIVAQRPSPQPFIGAFFSHQRTGWRVEMVLNNSAAEKAGLRKGDVVLKANGAPFSPILSLRTAGNMARLEFERSGVSLAASVAVMNADFITEAASASEASAKIIESNGKKIGYFRLWMMLSDSFRTSLINAATTQFRDTDAMILDLRDGFGGFAEGYADVFFAPSSLAEKVGQKTATYRRFGYRKPLVVLINGGTRSAKESLSYLLKSSHRATLIGTRTAGKLLGSSPFRIADWAILQVPVVNVLLDGKRFEGVGIEPDIVIADEFGPNGEDLYIKKALDVLSRSDAD